jgi:hypothetical protein
VPKPQNNELAQLVSTLEAAMIKRKRLDHTELLGFGKMVLLLVKRQEIKMAFSLLTELDERTKDVQELAPAS